MRTLQFLLQKEFRQIFRNPAILRIIFIMPLIQLLVLPWAADYEIKNIRLAVVDHDHSSSSQKLISTINSSGYFQLYAYTPSYAQAVANLDRDQADLILEIPTGFEKNMIKENETSALIAVNAINGVKAGLGSAYLQSVIREYNNQIRTAWIQPTRFSPQPVIEVTASNWFNPLLQYKDFMVPGILVVLVTMVGSFLASLNIVKEKEIGTIEQMNVTPVKKHYFILAKLLPFWVLGLFVLSLGLLLAWAFYGIVPVGNLFVLYVYAAVYLLAVLGLGLLLSTYSENQQQAMLLSFFLIMVFILMSGLYTPIESMPTWAQYLTKLNPVSYFIQVIRMVLLKGSNLADISQQLFITTGFAIVLNTWAVVNYKKRT
ncbi:ABC transporter permease [Adhaeribacter pallidiroseus]|uniref:Inner membrane transport permease n=1 Tax=Adhaeribacter pallidiroseus TaxID=2072847 RepID=A0A369QC93_9BACT|nr:ABC transporter permease [Adhaeribacter pallidiroseus]RDC62324.1 Inner membrane transport permease [Adhaeribacter pallidiroseus]